MNINDVNLVQHVPESQLPSTKPCGLLRRNSKHCIVSYEYAAM